MNSGTAQPGSQHGGRTQLPEPGAPSGDHLAARHFTQGGTEKRTALFPAFQPAGAEPGPHSGPDGLPLFFSLGPRDRGRSVFRSKDPRGHGGTRVRHPKLGNLVANKRGPPAARCRRTSWYRDRGSTASAPCRHRVGLSRSPASSRRRGSSPRRGAFPGECGAEPRSRPCCKTARPLPSDRRR